MAQSMKNLPEMEEPGITGSIPGLEDLLEEEMPTHNYSLFISGTHFLIQIHEYFSLSMNFLFPLYSVFFPTC